MKTNTNKAIVGNFYGEEPASQKLRLGKSASQKQIIDKGGILIDSEDDLIQVIKEIEETGGELTKARKDDIMQNYYEFIKNFEGEECYWIR